MQLDPQLLEILACPQCHVTAARRRRGAGAGLHVGHVRAGLPRPRRDPRPADRRGAPTLRQRLMMLPTDESVLDDLAALDARDPGGMLRAVGSAGAQVREALLRLDDDAVRAVSADGRPRALVVAGMGGSGIAGDVVAAVAGPSCAVPIVVSRGYRLPGWVGPLDLVIAVSCSGETEETLAAADEAVRRGARVVTAAKAGSSLSARAAGGRAVQLDIDSSGRMPRANLWAHRHPAARGRRRARARERAAGSAGRSRRPARRDQLRVRADAGGLRQRRQEDGAAAVGNAADDLGDERSRRRSRRCASRASSPRTPSSRPSTALSPRSTTTRS